MRRVLPMLKIFALVIIAAVTIIWPSASPAGATAGNSITSPDTAGVVGQHTSLALDADGYPVVSYIGGSGNLKVLHCGNANCTADNTIASPDLGGNDEDTSLALDADGNPVVSYYDISSADLKVLHCDDPDCAGDETANITSPDTTGDVGRFSSLALDASGRPVVSYYRNDTSHDLKVLHCGNVNCTAGNSITSPETLDNVGRHSSLALDANGNPVISYQDAAPFTDLKLLDCDDLNCAGNEAANITSPKTVGSVGFDTSLALDANGKPVVSYYDASNGSLQVLHCGNVNCTAGNTNLAPDPAWLGNDVGLDTSLVLDSSGKPVVSYRDRTNRNLKVVVCGDVNCGAGNKATSVDTAGDVGEYSSLALDGNGNPVVSYYDVTNGNLKVLHCGKPDCQVVAPTPGPTPGPVGGIAELAPVDGAALETQDSSGNSAGAPAGIAVAVAAGAVALGGGALGAGWYARRRSRRD